MRKLYYLIEFTVFFVVLTVLTVGCGNNFNGNNSRRNQFNENGTNTRSRSPLTDRNAPLCSADFKADNDRIGDLVRPAKAILDTTEKARATGDQRATVQSAVNACVDHFRKYDPALTCNEPSGRTHYNAELKRSCDSMNVYVN